MTSESLYILLLYKVLEMEKMAKLSLLGPEAPAWQERERKVLGRSLAGHLLPVISQGRPWFRLLIFKQSHPYLYGKLYL